MKRKVEKYSFVDFYVWGALRGLENYVKRVGSMCVSLLGGWECDRCTRTYSARVKQITWSRGVFSSPRILCSRCRDVLLIEREKGLDK